MVVKDDLYSNPPLFSKIMAFSFMTCWFNDFIFFICKILQGQILQDVLCQLNGEIDV